MGDIKSEAYTIINESIKDVLPYQAVEKALLNKTFTGSIVVVSIGKAAWTMAEAAKKILGSSITKGIVVTKYEHSRGNIDGFEIIEAGHPVPDENSVLGTELAIKAVENLRATDQVIFLISGGGSALFEKPAEGLTLSDMKEVTGALLKCGANIVEINTIRKHLSDVKGGRFASICAPAKVYSIVLSDVIGDRLDSIASGPAYPDSSTVEEAQNIIKKYNLLFNETILKALTRETPKELSNVETVITGSVSELCKAVAENAKSLGYTPFILTSTLECEASEAGKFISSIAREVRCKNPYGIKAPCAVIAGGETTVKIKGTGLGGRNQEIALTAAKGIAGMKETLIFSLGSDGTDGPTDAAGGMVDGETLEKLKGMGLDLDEILNNNDSYHGLKAVDGLIMTGATGTNVNDVMVVLCK
ncbi:glycerate kinase [Anaerocolumna sp. AGMB13025]|uniref:glycerate kinase type-2 family protein n=1 Tax=Anaerocolumna sp. AGMB13025 TaxID=3039116 RepID=UPI00241C2221|nr:glycerate kinase [Anaerocolumna sp. AGMB13025]WFR59468.1 glycerate kinase [Anaerocolumna sp. AGMB13025]